VSPEFLTIHAHERDQALAFSIRPGLVYRAEPWGAYTLLREIQLSSSRANSSIQDLETAFREEGGPSEDFVYDDWHNLYRFADGEFAFSLGSTPTSGGCGRRGSSGSSSRGLSQPLHRAPALFLAPASHLPNNH